jgi:hypothetical protein
MNKLMAIQNQPRFPAKPKEKYDIRNDPPTAHEILIIPRDIQTIIADQL